VKCVHLSVTFPVARFETVVVDVTESEGADAAVVDKRIRMVRLWRRMLILKCLLLMGQGC
jgi:hypothetical protein